MIRRKSFTDTPEALGDIFIYALMDDRIRYIGISVNPEARFKQHISAAKRNHTLKEQWICRCLENMVEIRLKIIRKNLRPERASELERQIIKKLKDKVLNIAHGGEGVRTYEVSAPADYWCGVRFSLAQQIAASFALPELGDWQQTLGSFDVIREDLLFNPSAIWESARRHGPHRERVAACDQFGRSLEVMRWHKDRRQRRAAAMPISSL